jgi:hypothetical protein
MKVWNGKYHETKSWSIFGSPQKKTLAGLCLFSMSSKKLYKGLNYLSKVGNDMANIETNHV